MCESFRILHDVLCEGKVACICLNLGAFGRGVPWGSLGRTYSKSSAQCARRARAVQGFPL